MKVRQSEVLCTRGGLRGEERSIGREQETVLDKEPSSPSSIRSGGVIWNLPCRAQWDHRARNEGGLRLLSLEGRGRRFLSTKGPLTAFRELEMRGYARTHGRGGTIGLRKG